MPAARKSAPRAASKRAAPRKPTAPRQPAAGAALSGVVERLTDLQVRLQVAVDGLGQALAEAPRAEEFQPLADHIYEFARLAPPLLESLREAPRLLAPLEPTARALQEVSETLHFAHESFNESLLRLPRADEFEPLAAPLREFARVAPALAESLSEVLRLARPLADSAARVEALAQPLTQATRRLDLAAATLGAQAAVQASAAHGAPAAGPAAAAAACMERARVAILEALASLPREREYAQLAGQLRELASVSPSLLDWLGEVRASTAPLEAAVAGLRAAAADLAEGQRALRAAGGQPAERPGDPGHQA